MFNLPKHQTNHRVPLRLLLKCHVYQPTPSHCSAGPKPWLIFYVEHIALRKSKRCLHVICGAGRYVGLQALALRQQSEGKILG